jgi:tetratricopeptide (TPR) repeat protein
MSGLRRLAFVLGVACFSLQAQAQELSDERAGILFNEGLAAFDAGRTTDAVAIWEQVLAQASSTRAWRVHYNLGLAYEALGARPKAIESYELFSRRVGEQPGSLPIDFEQRRQDAVDRAARLRPFVALLRVLAPESGEPVLVRLGSGEARPAGFSQYLEPGTVTVSMGEGARKVDETVTVAAGELRTMIAHQLPPPPPPPPPPYEPPIPNVVIVLTASAAAASLALPIALFVKAADARDVATGVPTFLPGYALRQEDFKDARAAYQASYALPAGLAAVATAFLIINVVDSAGASETEVPRVGFSIGPAHGAVTMRLSL